MEAARSGHKLTLPVTIVVPMYNEEATLGTLFGGLIAQTALPAELIFVDAGSTDGSREIVDLWWKREGWPGGECRVIESPGALPGAGRNKGIEAAGNRRIAFLDAGICPAPGWLEALYSYADKHSVPAVFGHCHFNAEAPVEKAICALSYGCEAYHAAIPGSMFDREVFERVGRFKPNLRAAEDVLWVRDFLGVYGERSVCEEAIAYYRHFPQTFWQAMRKWFVYEKYVAIAGASSGFKVAYQAGCFLLPILSLALPRVGVPLMLAHALLRGGIDPMRRSGWRPWWRGSWKSAIIALFCGPCLDWASFLGYWTGKLKGR